MQKQFRSRLRQLGISTASIGAATLAIYGVRVQIEHAAPALSVYLQIALWVGLALISVGVLLVVAAWLWPDPRPSRRYDVRRARPADLNLIHDIGEELFESPVSDLTKMRAWYDLNARIFYVVKKISARPGHVTRDTVGYYCVLPLKNSAVRLVVAGELKGTDFTSQHIAQPRSKYHSIYVGGIAARGWRAQGHTLGYLKARITEETENGVEAAYTRPVTSDGLRVAQQHGFQPVETPAPADPLGRVHTLRLRDLAP